MSTKIKNETKIRIVLLVFAGLSIVTRFVFWPKDDLVLEQAFRAQNSAGHYSKDQGATIFTGVITDDPVIQNNSAKFTLNVQKIEQQNSLNGIEKTNKENTKNDATSVSVAIKVSQTGPHNILVNANSPNFHYGDEISIKTFLKKPQKIVNEDGRSFDYVQYLAKDNIFYTATVGNINSEHESNESSSSQQYVYMLSHNNGNPIIASLYKFKAIFVDHINHMLPSPDAFLASGLIVTGKGSLDKDLQNQFQRVGLIHIVVLSGFNVTIVGESVARLFAFLPLLASTFLGAVSIILFSIMVGGGSTVIRSVIMSFIGLYARISGRQNSALVSLVIAGALMLMWNPMLGLYDPSFQLSFAATLGLILYARPLETFLSPLAKKLRTPPWLLQLVSSTLSTQLFTMPLIMQLSGIVSLVALPVNVMVLPFIPVTMFFVFVAGLASFIGPLLSVLPAFVSWILLSYELAVVSHASSFSFAAIQLPPVSVSIVLLMYIFLLFVGIRLYKKEICKTPP